MLEDTGNKRAVRILLECILVSMMLSLQCEHLHLILILIPIFFVCDTSFFRCRCYHNWVQNPFHDDIKAMKITPVLSRYARSLTRNMLIYKFTKMYFSIFSMRGR